MSPVLLASVGQCGGCLQLQLVRNHSGDHAFTPARPANHLCSTTVCTLIVYFHNQFVLITASTLSEKYNSDLKKHFYNYPNTLICVFNGSVEVKNGLLTVG